MVGASTCDWQQLPLGCVSIAKNHYEAFRLGHRKVPFAPLNR